MESEAQRGYSRLLQRLAYRSTGTVTSPLTSFGASHGVTTTIIPSTHSTVSYTISTMTSYMYVLIINYYDHR